MFTSLSTRNYVPDIDHIFVFIFSAAYRKAQDINLHSICLHVLSDSFRRWVLVVLQIPDIMKTTCVTYHAGDDVQY